MKGESASLLSRLVDALVAHVPAGRAEPLALLIQKNPRDAALLVGGERVVVLLACGDPEPLGEVLARRVDAALGAERPEVLRGVRESSVMVVLVGGPPLQQSAAALPALAPRSEVALDFCRVVDGRVEDGPSVAELKADARDAVDRHRRDIRAALEQGLAALAAGTVRPPSAQELAASEREGEHLLATEGVFARRLEHYWPLFVAIALPQALVWVAGLIFGGGGDQLLYRMGSAWGRDVERGEWWRLVCAGWLHANVGHIGSNLLGLVLFIGPVSAALGGARTFVLFALCALGGFAFNVAIKPDDDGVGASGGVFGLMSALVCLGLRRRADYLPRSSGAGWALFAALYLGFNLIMSLRGGVSLLGHAGGALTAAALVLGRVITFGLPPLDGGPGPRWGRALTGALLAATIGVTTWSFAIQLTRQHPWVIRWPPPAVEVRLAPSSYALRAPASLAESIDRSDESGEHFLGRLRADPVALGVILRARDPDLPDGEQPALDALAARYDRRRREKPAGEQPAAPRQVSLGAHRWVLLDESWSKREHLQERRYLRADGDHEIDVAVYLDNEANHRWAQAADRAVDSIARSDGK